MMKTPFESSAMLDRGGKPTVRELLSSMVFNPVDGTIRLNGDRLVMQRAAVGLELRRELIRLLGPEETRVFLIRLGYLCGQADARFVRSSWPNLNVGDAFTAGTRLHMFSGVVRVETVHNDFDFRKKRFSGEFLWHDSVEAVEGRRYQQAGTGSVCWTQTGYASGYASEFFDTLIVYKEISCAADGHKHCRVVGKPADIWGLHDPEVILFRDRIAGTSGAAPARRVAPPRLPEAELSALDQIVLGPVRTDLDRLARTALPVLIAGPAGSGRFRAARYLHRASGGLPADLRRVTAVTQTPEGIADLFAGPGKPARRSGALETIVIDDIADMPAPTQARLAAMLEEGLAVGGPRIVALASQPPGDLRAGQALRPDLWFALAALPVVMPALDDHPQNRLAVADALLPVVAERLGIGPVALATDARGLIAQSDWPGNIAEMRAVLTAAMAGLAEGAPLTAAHLRAQRGRIGARAPAIQTAGGGFADWLHGALADGGIEIEEIERMIQETAVSRTNGNLSAAARLLGLTRAQLSYRLGTARGKGGSEQGKGTDGAM